MVRPNQDVRHFKFDCVLDQSQDQYTAYDQIAYPVVQDVLNGFNGVIMAYGQTGSGKTHTIFGSKASLDHLYANINNRAMGGQAQNNISSTEDLHYESGIVPRCVSHLFDYIKQNPNKAQFRVTMSFLEIYNEQITDLLLQTGAGSSTGNLNGGTIGQNGTGQNHARHQSQSPIRQGASSTSLNQATPGINLKLREDPKTGIFVDGLTQVNVKSKEQLYQLIKIGAKRRSVNQTAMNKNSSRSHAVLQIFVEQRWVETGNGSNNDINGSPPRSQRQNGMSGGGQYKKRHFRKALLTIVDLAGSERLSKTGSEGMRLQEAKNINKSIAALSNCISALASEKSIMHVPFRDSKLTRLLTESLGGNSKTTICACISPSLIHYDESFSTLLFAARAMSVRTFVTMNEKIEYKPIDEHGRSLTPGSSTKLQQTPNEKVLMKQNSKLQEETEELRQEIINLREQLKKQQSMMTSSSLQGSNQNMNIFNQSSPYQPKNQGNGLMMNGGNQIANQFNAFQNNYNSNNTNNNMQNTSMDGATQLFNGQINNWGVKAGQSRNNNIQNLNSQQIPRSQSPNPGNTSYNPMMSQVNSQNNNNQKQLFSTQYSQSPQKTNLFQNNYMINQITPQDSENFPTSQQILLDSNGNLPIAQSSGLLQNSQNGNFNHQISGNNSYSNMNNIKQVNQVVQQLQKDAKLTQKLCSIIETLQDELCFKTTQIEQLKQENASLKDSKINFNESQGITQMQSQIDQMLSNPMIRGVLLERLKKYSQ